jgi:hypothetical protein
MCVINDFVSIEDFISIYIYIQSRKETKEEKQQNQQNKPMIVMLDKMVHWQIGC